MQLRLFNTSGPRCLDGTIAGYYVDSAAGSGRGSMHGGAGAQVVVWLEGGGACFSEDDCEQRAKGDLGRVPQSPAEPSGRLKIVFGLRGSCVNELPKKSKAL